MSDRTSFAITGFSEFSGESEFKSFKKQLALQKKVQDIMKETLKNDHSEVAKKMSVCEADMCVSQRQKSLDLL